MNLHTVTLQGASDDLVEVDGSAPGCDEYAGADIHFVLVGASAEVRVRVWFTRRGVWAIAAAPTSEDAPMLPVLITSDRRSALATVHDVCQVIREDPRS